MRAGAQHPLAPAPATDRLLGRLVEIVRGEFEPDAARPPRSAASRVEVGEHVLSRIHAEPALLERSRALRSYAACAETAMEHHYSRRLLRELSALAPLAARPPAALPWLGAWRMQRIGSSTASSARRRCAGGA